jgi:hypothetical protein
MTCREKLKREHPNEINERYSGGCTKCPADYCYLDDPSYCDHGVTNAICTKCWDREIPGTEPVKEEIKPTTIYYAHHQWKYGTKIEEYELDLIRRKFPHAEIFNPAIDLKFKDCGDEEIIMDECLNKVLESDIVIFSAMDGMIGIGVYNEIMAAKEACKLVLCLTSNKLYSTFSIYESPECGSDRLYARVGVPMYY